MAKDPACTAEVDFRRSEDGSEAKAFKKRLRQLRARRAELLWRLETGELQAQNTVLEHEVLEKRTELGSLKAALQVDKDAALAATACLQPPAEHHLQELAALAAEVTEATSSTMERDRCAVCLEDLRRFTEEQRLRMVDHGKAQCRSKDDQIRHMTLRLTERTIDWQRLGTTKETAASLTHELDCLRSRHRQLQLQNQAQQACAAKLRRSLEQSDEDEQNDQRGGAEAATAAADAFRCQHACIWQDQLRLRERQLQRMVEHLEYMEGEQEVARGALRLQEARCEEVERQRDEEEEALRELQLRKELWQERDWELQRVEAQLSRLMNAAVSSSAAPAGGSCSAEASKEVLGQSSASRRPPPPRAGYAAAAGASSRDRRPQPCCGGGGTSGSD
eukprot:TRINITY_DN43385_c0_g1_i1.p1 TRINITY_DN43385_c0_g1~~TRINITY_DN43385_c0_g1_i1.p1  ORF type:complete len:391 (+),score=135.85 TRINITY_DN43385_c0_g1_i1:130-1302(+)